MRYERIPGPQGAVATALFRELSRFIPEQHLSFGGGTVLAARWQHRDSLDVDLFCEPGTYARLTPATRSQIEEAMHGIAGCATERTWCEDIATYTEIEGIEATVLPRTIAIEPTTPSRLEHTRLAVQSTAQILYAKIAWRMYEGGEIAVRDAYDLACARLHDPHSLTQARAQTSQRVLTTIAEIIKQLPDGWTAGTEKRLLNPHYAWTEAEIRKGALAALNPQGETSMPQRQGLSR